MKRLGFIILLFCAFTIKAQNILNGSFEMNNATSHIHALTNVQYSSVISFSSSFGNTGGEISLFKSGGGYIHGILLIRYWLKMETGLLFL